VRCVIHRNRLQSLTGESVMDHRGRVSHDTMSTSVGELLAGRYRLLRVLGRGGMSAVWAAHDELLGRDVALKEVAPPPGQPGESPGQLRERALREARAAARVAHHCAVTVFDVAEGDGAHWIVMELLPPRTLADELALSGRLPAPAAARIGLDLLEALASAHAAGVLHRDVKPSNVLLTEGRAVLADFGIATVDGDAPGVEHGLVVGSPAYMAPERARGEAPSPASDLWALGATLYAAVEGRPPFWREAPLPTLTAVLTEDAPAPQHAGPLAGLVTGLLARDPATRPDAALARRVLQGVLTSPTEVLPAPVPGQGQTPADVAAVVDALDATRQVPRPRRRAAPVAMAACAAAALLGLGEAVSHYLPLGDPAAGAARGAEAVFAPAPVHSPAAKTRAATRSAAPTPRATQVVHHIALASAVVGASANADGDKERGRAAAHARKGDHRKAKDAHAGKGEGHGAKGKHGD
jgi:hypothetical protein